MEEAEKISLSTSLPELIKHIEVSPRFKAALYASAVVDGETLDSLIVKNNGQNFVFQIVQKLKRANGPETFSNFQNILSETGQTEAVRVLQAELVKHSGSRGSADMRPGRTSKTVAASRSVHPKPEVTYTDDPPSFIQAEQPNEALSADEIAELRASLRSVLPPRGTAKELGDVLVTDEYYSKVYKFISDHDTPPPGPMPEIDTSKSFYNQNTFCYLPPGCCAMLNRTYGRQAILTYGRKKGHMVLRQLDSTVAYCLANITLSPGALHKRSVWISTRGSLRHGISTLVNWTKFVGRVEGTTKLLDLSVSADQWYIESKNMGFTVERLGRPAQEMSISEKRRLLDHCITTGRNDEVKCPVGEHYGREVMEFASSESVVEPGALQAPSDKAPVHNVQNLIFLSVECCATLIEMYGGKATLVRGTESDCRTLDNMDCSTLFVTAHLYLYSKTGFKSDCPIGVFYFNVASSLKESIGAAIGWYPARARNHKADYDLDLQMSVRKWYNRSKTTAILLWPD